MKFNEEAPPSGSKSFLKLSNGDSTIGVFKGNLEVFYQVFENGKYRTVPKDDANGQFKFRVNFITKENGVLVAKIFSGNWHDYKALKDYHEEYNLETIFMKVTQTGERQTKRISFMPMTKTKPDAATINGVALQELKPKDSRSLSPAESLMLDDSPMPSGFDEEVPF